MEKKESYLIFAITFNWSTVHQVAPHELSEKLRRDQLCPERNTFFFFTWGRTGYQVLEGARRQVQVRTYGLNVLRPLLNVWALFVVPYTAWRHGVRPDVWLAYDFGMVPALWLCKKLFGGRLLMIVNNQPRLYSRVRHFGRIKSWYSALMEYLFRGLPEHYFTLNSTMRDYLEGLGVQREKISFYVVNTIERDAEHVCAAKKGLVRARYHIPPEKKVLLAVARLEAEKNYETLFDLFSTLPDTYVLVCLGEGSLRAELEARISRLGIAERVYLPGFVERSDIWNYYAEADAFVLLSRTEALGIVFWEAMYMGVPCIGAAVPGIAESLGENGERGVLWHAEEGEGGFKHHVVWCTTESGERTAMLAQAKAFVLAQLEHRQTINDYLRSISILQNE